MRTRSFVGLIVAVVSMLMLTWIAGCGEDAGPAQVDRVGAQAQSTQPVSTEVELVSIANDSGSPVTIVVLEDFVMAASGVTSGGGAPATPTIIDSGGLGGGTTIVNLPTGGGSTVITPGKQIGPGATAQLISHLRQRIGNIKVYDCDIKNGGLEKIRANLKPNERGPYVIKGAITEFSETADASTQGQSKGPNSADLMLGAVGTIKYLYDSSKGRKTTTETKHVGMVGLDIKIIDPTTGEVIASFPATGTFTSISKTVSETKGGKTVTSSDYASSAIGQAQRIAMNQAVTQIHAALKERAQQQATLVKK